MNAYLQILIAMSCLFTALYLLQIIGLIDITNPLNTSQTNTTATNTSKNTTTPPENEEESANDNDASSVWQTINTPLYLAVIVAGLAGAATAGYYLRGLRDHQRSPGVIEAQRHAEKLLERNGYEFHDESRTTGNTTLKREPYTIETLHLDPEDQTTRWYAFQYHENRDSLPVKGTQPRGASHTVIISAPNIGKRDILKRHTRITDLEDGLLRYARPQRGNLEPSRPGVDINLETRNDAQRPQTPENESGGET